MDNLETNLSEKTQKHYKEENKNLESIETKCMYIPLSSNGERGIVEGKSYESRRRNSLTHWLCCVVFVLCV
jgi:hypothetical protein